MTLENHQTERVAAGPPMHDDSFDRAWEAYCDSTGHPIAENRAFAEEWWNSGQMALLRPLLGAGDEDDDAN